MAIFSLKRLVGKGEQKGREDREGTDEKEIQLQPASYDNMSVQQDKFLLAEKMMSNDFERITANEQLRRITRE